MSEIRSLAGTLEQAQRPGLINDQHTSAKPAIEWAAHSPAHHCSTRCVVPRGRTASEHLQKYVRRCRIRDPVGFAGHGRNGQVSGLGSKPDHT